MSNVKTAIDYAVVWADYTNPGGIIAYPMFEGATKHDVEKVKKGILAKLKVSNLVVTKKHVVVTLI